MYVLAPARTYWQLNLRGLLVQASRDQILLDGEDLRSDDEGDEEEVFALKGIPGGDSDEDDEEEEVD